MYLQASQRIKKFIPWIGPVLFGTYLVAGNIKGDPRLSAVPVDLTVLLAVLSAVVALSTLLQRDFAFPKEFKTILLMYLVFAVPAIWTIWGDYGELKASRFFTLTLLSSALPFLLLQSRENVVRFGNVLTALSILLAADAIVIIATNFGAWQEGARLLTASADTVALARMLGFASIWILVNNLDKSGSRLAIALISSTLLLALMFATGSRGPMLAYAVSFIAIALMSRSSSASFTLRIALVLFCCVVALWVGSIVAPSASVDRVAASFREDPLSDTRENISVVSRAQAITIAFESIASNPLGIGWGGLNDFLREHNDDLVYPHNLVLEVVGELGWIPGLVLLFVIGSVLVKSGSAALKSEDPVLQAFFSVLVFFLVNSLLSGDLNDNRILFSLLSVGAFSDVIQQQSAGLSSVEDESSSDLVVQANVPHNTTAEV